MTKESIDSILNNNNVCEAAGCFAKATVIIEVKVGEQGNIPLSLCSKCVIKFEDESSTTIQLHKERSLNHKITDTTANIHHIWKLPGNEH